MTQRNILPYNPKLTGFARKLRNTSTLSEVLLWRHLKSRQIKGYQFLRQKPIDIYIVDFFCKALMLAIEIDGETHNFKADADSERQKKIESLGITILRFLDIDVKRNMDGVLTVIRRCIEDIEGKHPPGPPQGGN